MTTVRIFFEKRGEAAYISLLDLQRVFHRVLKRSGLPVYYTQGFNPHIYLAFSNPLSLGQESVCESCEVKTEAENLDFAVWQATLQPYMPRGIVITKVAPAVHKMGLIAAARYHITMPAAAAPALDAYNAAASVPVTKKTKRGQKTVELKEILPAIVYETGAEELTFPVTLPCAADGLNLNPALLFGALQELGETAGTVIEPWRCLILRTALELADGTQFC